MPNQNDAKDAAQFGLQGQGGQRHVDGQPLDYSYKNKVENPHNVDLGNDDAKFREDEKMKEAHRKIVESGGLTLADLGMKGPATQMGSGIERAAENVATDLMHQGYNNPTPDEAALLAESYGGRPTTPSGSWGAQKFQARIKGVANPVPVWKVIDEDTKMEVPTVFRVQEPADRAAAILNETGNLNDPRFKNLIRAYNEHVRLMKEARQMRRAIKEGRTALKPKLQEVLGELEAINYKLGI